MPQNMGRHHSIYYYTMCNKQLNRERSNSLPELEHLSSAIGHQEDPGTLDDLGLWISDFLDHQVYNVLYYSRLWFLSFHMTCSRVSWSPQLSEPLSIIKSHIYIYTYTFVCFKEKSWLKQIPWILLVIDCLHILELK